MAARSRRQRRQASQAELPVHGWVVSTRSPCRSKVKGKSKKINRQNKCHNTDIVRFVFLGDEPSLPLPAEPAEMAPESSGESSSPIALAPESAALPAVDKSGFRESLM
jgi:hypothetical protein